MSKPGQKKEVLGRCDDGTHLARARGAYGFGPVCPMGHNTGGTGHMGRDTSECDVTPPALMAGVATPGKAAGARERNREALRADPRFASWEAGAPAKPLDLGPSLEDLPPSPEALRVLERRHEDQRELLRRAAVLALVDGGRHLDPDQLRVAKARAALPPLNRPLGTGEPTT